VIRGRRAVRTRSLALTARRLAPGASRTFTVTLGTPARFATSRVRLVAAVGGERSVLSYRVRRPAAPRRGTARAASTSSSSFVCVLS